MSKNRLFLSTILLLLLLVGCGRVPATPETEAPPTPDPYAGLVLVPDGAGGHIWVKKHETLPVMSLAREDFRPNGSYIDYVGSEALALRGIDVSEHQGEIDWEAVAADGVEFAIIRAGYRGYTQGALKEDLCFVQNMEGALAAGLEVGVYFFSQATSPEEAREEARYVLGQIAPYQLRLPVCYDWEPITWQEARTDEVDNKTLTDCALAFGDVVRQGGYEPMVYFFRDMGYNRYDLSRLGELGFWVGAVGEAPDFYYDHSIWQYSYTGQVSGITGGCDLDLYFLPPPLTAPAEVPEAPENAESS